jgi:hypothetical protein
MRLLYKAITVLTLATMLTATQVEAVGLFGGAIGTTIPCANAVTYNVIGAPRGGAYIWGPMITRTYSYGPPTHTGQWLLGTYGPPYFCLVTILPLIVVPGLTMMMLGSSE